MDVISQWEDFTSFIAGDFYKDPVCWAGIIPPIVLMRNQRLRGVE